MSAPLAVEAKDLVKTFRLRVRAGKLRREVREVAAVSGVDLAIVPGEMVGYIGPNGAGKSTTIKMLTGILTPTSGSVAVDGIDPTRDRRTVARRIGVVFGQRSQLNWDLPLIDSFRLLHHVYATEPDRHRHVLGQLTEAFDLSELLAMPVRQLSLGQRMRGELAAALLHEPRVLFLDEPTIGLDIVSKDAVREALAHLNAESGVTVMLTTHDLSDIERLCPRMVIIDNGKVISDGPIEDMRTRLGHERTLVIDFESSQPPVDIAQTQTVRVDGARQWLRFSRNDTDAASVLAAAAAMAPVRDLSIEETPIEEIVRRIYTD